MVVVGLSLLAALAFACGAVLQQHAAAAQPVEYYMRPSLVVRLLRRPMWLAGIGMNGLGTLLQLAALWRGTLVTVQPLLVCGLIFALPINAIWMHRRRPGVRESISAGAVCIGLTAFLLATSPTKGNATASPATWAVSLGVLAALTGCLIAAARGARGPARAGVLAVAAGMINGLSAAFIKGIARQLGTSLHHGVLTAGVGLLENWELYAFGVSLLCSLLLVQSAYQSGPIRWSLPALTAVNPVTSVIIGATVLSEQIHTDAVALLGSVVGLSLVVTGILTLSSSSLIPGGAADSAVLEAALGPPVTGAGPVTGVGPIKGASPVGAETVVAAQIVVDPGPGAETGE